MDKTAEYTAWIINYVADTRQSRIVTLFMAFEFPELTLVEGEYHCPLLGERHHWWLQSSDGTVIDPTADKFPSYGTGVYVSDREITGTCTHCRKKTYDNRTYCSLECSIKMAKFSHN